MPRKKTTPIGIELYKGKTPKWRIGKELGNGACASVHVLEEIDGTPTEWAIKVAPIPTKKTKKGNSMEEVNDRMLHHEHVMYQNQFQDIQGVYVPRLPPYRGPKTNGEAEGYRFLVMEQMASPLFDVVPQLLKCKKTTKTIAFGPIAVQLLKCVQAIQERKHVVIDIKPENFMLSCDTGKGSTAAQKLASRVRMLDLALVQPWASIGSHRSNDGTSGLAGTPLYASLNVHRGETPSRRDDLEALGYVIAELIMKLASGNASMELPWSDGQSDEEIGEIKAAVIGDVNSDFYSQLGGTTVVKVFKEYLDTVREYTYKKTPDYDDLEQILSQLKISVPRVPTPRKNSKRVSSKKQQTPASPAPLSGNKRVTRSSTRSSTRSASPEDRSPAKMARDDSYMEVEDVDTSFHTIEDAQPLCEEFASPSNCVVLEDEIEEGAGADDDAESFATAMDWEQETDENNKPKEDLKPQAIEGVTVIVDSGPHEGEAINLVKGRCDSVVVGRNPEVKGGETAFILPDDLDIDDSHIRIDLAITKKLTGVVITDLKSSAGSYIGSEKIRSGKDWKIFRGSSVRIGNSLLRIATLDTKKIAINSSHKKNTGRKQPARGTGRKPPAERSSNVPEKKTARKDRWGVQINVIEGPHEGESYVLERGVSEGFNIGKKPSGASEEKITLRKDADLKATHVRIELVNNKKLKAALVIDKSKGGTLVNRNKVTKGRAFVNDQISIGNTVLMIKPL